MPSKDRFAFAKKEEAMSLAVATGSHKENQDAGYVTSSFSAEKASSSSDYETYTDSKSDNGSKKEEILPPMNGNTATVSVLGADLVIEGSVSSQSDLVIEGTVNGDVTCQQNVEVRGKVNGNVQGKNLWFMQAQITGDVQALESLVAQNSTITGNVNASTADIDSPVKGDIVTEKMLYIRKSAVITGNIVTSAISVEENAILDGKLSVRTK